MRRQAGWKFFAVQLGVFSGLGFASGQGAPSPSPIHLKPGDYVLADTPCKDAPFAAMRSWTGSALAGPHDSACSTRVLDRQKNTFHVDTVCHAAGDGSPVEPSHEAGTLTITGPQSFTFAPGATASTPAAYRWCPAS